MSLQSVPTVVNRPYRCFVCEGLSIVKASTIRVFSGSYGGGSFAACAEHANQAIDRALEPLVSYDINPSTYRVAAYHVVRDSIDPIFFKTGRLIWTAKRKSA